MKRLIILATLGILAISACKRREDPKPSGDVAGKGGNAGIAVTPKHHAKYIDSCTVYLKYNTLDLPSATFDASKYDESVKCVKINDSVGVANFTGLKKGNYYLYGVGWDRNIMDTVVGGKPLTITGDSTYNINLSVTEGD